MKLYEIMTKDVVTVVPEESIGAAARLMRETGVGSLVVARNGALKGIITDRDLLGCLSEAHDPERCKVLLHMSKPVIVEPPEEDLLTAAEVMAERRIRRLPVVQRGRLVGIVSLSDMARLTHEQMQSVWPLWNSLNRLIRAQASSHTEGRAKSAGNDPDVFKTTEIPHAISKPRAGRALAG